MKRILIADDSETARMFTRKCLEIAGLRDAEFEEVKDGLEALVSLKTRKPDLLVTDLFMPRMGGEELLRRVKTMPELAGLLIFVITSSGNPTKEKEMRALGAAHIISKPISPAKISKALASGPVTPPVPEPGPESPSAKLFSSVQEAIEAMAFMDVKALKLYRASIPIQSPVAGRMTAFCPEILAQQIAANMFGSEPGTQAEDRMLDAVAELANIVAGRLMSHFAARDQKINLGIPEKGIGIPALSQDRCHAEYFELSGQAFFITLHGAPLLQLMGGLHTNNSR